MSNGHRTKGHLPWNRFTRKQISMKCLCTTCEKPIQFHSSMLGQRTICPHCRHEVVLPSEPAGGDVAEEELVDLSRPVSAPNFTPAPQMYYTEQARLQTAYRVPNFTCPFCHTNMPPRSVEKISAAGWITFAVLLTVCLPLCWIGLLITEPERHCSGCGMKLG